MAESVEDSGKRYREALDATRDQREQIREDLEFSDPSNPQQWDAKEKQQREGDPGGARPCLVFDQTGQYVSNVAGQVEQRPPAMHAIPAGGGADKKVAEQYDGFFRHIEHTSNAQQHYSRALTSAARAGVGYLVVRPDFVDRALNWQEPRISSEGDPLRVVFDPWSVALDGSDANFGYLLTPYSVREFERQFGKKAEKIGFGDEEQRYVNDDRESILVAEEWCAEEVKTNMIVCVGADDDELSLSEAEYWAAQKAGRQLQYVANYWDKKRFVYWRKLSGAAILQEAKDRETGKVMPYPASSIGLVPVYGYVGFTDGRMRYCGIPRRARSSQQAYNYHMSEMRVLMGQAAKAPYQIPVRAFGGDDNIKRLWDKASVESRAFLPYHDQDEMGAIAQPQRVQSSINLQNHIAGSLQAREDIQAAVGMYAANIGRQSNATSGVAYDAQKQQGEASTAHFPAHLAASIGQVGRICLEMVPRLIDTRRQLRILGIDMTPGSVTVDPKQEGAIQETSQGLVINPNVGRYDVRVTVGASYATQRQETSEALTEMIRANPEMMPVVGPLWAQTLDFPNADKLAQVLTAMAPPQVQAVLNPGASKQPTAADLMQQIEQLKGALQEATQIAQEAQQDADEANDKLNAKEAENEIKRYEAETNRLKVTGANEEQITAIVGDLINQMLSSPAPLGDEPAPELMPQEPAEGEPQSYEMQPMPGDLGQEQQQPPIEEPMPEMGEEAL
jgi:hypothetical protein